MNAWQVEQVIAEMRKEVKFMPPSQWDERKRLLMWANRLTAALQPRALQDQGPCYCCRGEYPLQPGQHPPHCTPGCRCYGHCDDPACCEPDPPVERER